jgi:predicted transcriptional regulator
LHRVHPIIEKREEFDVFLYTLFDELRDDENKFFNYFRMSVSSLDELYRRLKENLERCSIEIRNCIQPVEMLAVAIR